MLHLNLMQLLQTRQDRLILWYTRCTWETWPSIWSNISSFRSNEMQKQLWACKVCTKHCTLAVESKGVALCLSNYVVRVALCSCWSSSPFGRCPGRLVSSTPWRCHQKRTEGGQADRNRRNRTEEKGQGRVGIKALRTLNHFPSL